MICSCKWRSSYRMFELTGKRWLSWKSWQITGFSQDMGSLQLNEESAPSSSSSTKTPLIRGPDEVLVQVNAASINPIDIAMSKGYGHQILRFMRLPLDLGSEKVTYDRFPLTLGRDFSGVIVRKGSQVSKYKVGDQVWGVVSPHRQGSHANYLVVSQSEISLKPKNVNDVEAASIPYVGLTAWSALCTFGGLNESNCFGKRILILGGSGGVGTFAIQLLKAWGAHVSVTCSREAIGWLKEKTSVDDCIDYEGNELISFINSFDFVLNAASGQQKTINPIALKCLKKRNNSKYVTISSPLLRQTDESGLLLGGLRSAVKAGSDTFEGLREGVSVRWAFFMPNASALMKIKLLVEEERIKPVIESVFEFKEMPEAYRKASGGHARGKTVIKL